MSGAEVAKKAIFRDALELAFQHPATPQRDNQLSASAK